MHSLPSVPLLRAFDAVARTRSLTRAAAVLRRSQPALTIAMAKLEKGLDVGLLERGRSGAHLTEAGRILAHRTSRMFDRLDTALLDAAGAIEEQHLSDLFTDAQVRCMAALADHATVERAAEAIGITTASFRRTLQSLERLLARALLQPVVQGLGPTRQGAELARRVKLAVLEIAAGIEEIEIDRGRIRSRIAIGVVPLSATRLLSAAINDLLADYPEAGVTIAHGAYDPLLDDLRSARIDLLFGVLRLPEGIGDVIEVPLFLDPYVVAARKGHPLAGSRRLKLEDLARYDWIAPKTGTPRRQNLERMFKGYGVTPKIAIETSSLNVQRSLLLSSDRVTLLTRQEMEDQTSRGSLTALSFTPAIERGHDGIAMRRDWQPTSVQRKFLDLLVRRCRMTETDAPPDRARRLRANI